MESSLIDRWLARLETLPIQDEASVSLARQWVRDLGARAGLSAQSIEEFSIVVSELSVNQLTHARGGFLSVREISRGGVRGLEIVAADTGSGIGNPSEALSEWRKPDGSSLGAGLSGSRRLTDELDFDIRLDEGTCVIARKFSAKPDLSWELGFFGRALPGETVSGDDALFRWVDEDLILAIADGVGHGPLAREASACILGLFDQAPGAPLARLIENAQEAPCNSRGAMAALARFSGHSRELSWVGSGDITASIYDLRGNPQYLHFPSAMVRQTLHPRKCKPEETFPVRSGDLLVMHTDGLRSETSLSDRPDLQRKPSIVIAQTLLELYGRPNDDASVLVARFRANS